MATQARVAQAVIEVATSQTSEVNVSRVIVTVLLPTPPATVHVSRVVMTALIAPPVATIADDGMLVTIM